ncbi:MAG: acetylglutamate kinase [Planctomycetota bacterium]
MIDLASAADYVRLFRGATFVLKVGGACLERPGLVAELARQIAVIDACGAHPVLVHGAGPQVDQVQRSLGEEPVKVAGRRVTTEAALGALAEVARGTIGPTLAGELRRCGAAARLVPAEEVVTARRRPPVETEAGVVDFGLVGDIVAVDAAPLTALTAAGEIPILSPPVRGEDAADARLNANADLLAAHLAGALGAEKLVLVTTARGVLTDPNDPRSAISTLSLADIDGFEARGSIVGGMKVKVAAARQALDAGVPRVHVVSGIEHEALLGELFTTHGTGTLVTSEPEEPPAPPATGELQGAQA